MDYARPALADALAQQYAAGTLRAGARRRFEALLPGHPQLRRAVGDWQDRLMPLTASLPPQAPPARVWAGIERRLWPETRPATTAWWQRLATWRAWSAFATLATVALALTLVLPGPALPPVVVVLQGTGGAAGAAATNTIVASVSADGRALVARPVMPVSLQADRALELWSVPPEGAPRSLGLIAADGSTVLLRERLPATLLKGGTAALAVSLEPLGGSPTGTPTGPVLYAGKLQL